MQPEPQISRLQPSGMSEEAMLSQAIQDSLAPGSLVAGAAGEEPTNSNESFNPISTAAAQMAVSLGADTLSDAIVLLLHSTLGAFGFHANGTEQCLLGEDWRMHHGAGRMYGITYHHKSLAACCSCSIRGIALSDRSVLLCGILGRSDGSSANIPVQHTLQVGIAPSSNSSVDIFDWLNASGHASSIALECEAMVVRPLLLQLASERDATSPIAVAQLLLLLPLRIQECLMQFVDVTILCRLARCSSELRFTSSSNLVWRQHYVARWGTKAQTSYKQAYAHNVKLENEHRRQIQQQIREEQEREDRMRNQFVPYPGGPDRSAGDGLPYVPGIVGGDYDRDPFGHNPLRVGRPRLGPGLLPDGHLPRGSVPPGARIDPFNPLMEPRRPPRNPDDPGLPDLNMGLGSGRQGNGSRNPFGGDDEYNHFI